MKTPTELARRLRAMAAGARPHYNPNGERVRAILVTEDWIDDVRDAADLIDPPEVGLIGCTGCTGCEVGQCQKLKKGLPDVTQR